MNLRESYDLVRRSIVAFCVKYMPALVEERRSAVRTAAKVSQGVSTSIRRIYTAFFNDLEVAYPDLAVKMEELWRARFGD